MNIQKARDYAEILQEISKADNCSHVNGEIYSNILKNMAEGYNGCLCKTISVETKKTLEHLGFTIDKEEENNESYYIISWQQQTLI